MLRTSAEKRALVTFIYHLQHMWLTRHVFGGVFPRCRTFADKSTAAWTHDHRRSYR
jgi:hypothetical protein